MIKNILKEIKAVGLRDWLWFNICLHRNEFHPSLAVIQTFLNLKIGKYIISIIKEDPEQLQRRSKAHRIDNKINGN